MEKHTHNEMLLGSNALFVISFGSESKEKGPAEARPLIRRTMRRLETPQRGS